MRCRCRVCVFGNFWPFRSRSLLSAHPGPALRPVADLGRQRGASAASAASSPAQACPSPRALQTRPGGPGGSCTWAWR